MRPNAHTAAMNAVTGGRQLHWSPSGPQCACRLSQSIPFRQAACTQPLLQQRRCLEGHGRRQVRNAANPFDLAWGTSLNVDAQVMHLLSWPVTCRSIPIEFCICILALPCHEYIMPILAIDSDVS